MNNFDPMFNLSLPGLRFIFKHLIREELPHCYKDVVSGFVWEGGKIKIIVAKGAEGAKGVEVWGRGVPSPKKIFADFSLKEAILKRFKMIISLLCFNTIVNIIKVLKTNFLKQYSEY